MTTFTFGFEAEFENNVEPMLARLYADGLIADAHLHGYHCGCDSCSFDSPYPFRGQNDSSCGGEVITGVCDDMRTGRVWMERLQEAAVAADAEPSYRAGLHVHVGIKPMVRRGLTHGDVLWNYLRWEDVLGEVATGRFPQMRSFNMRLTDHLAHYHPDLVPDEMSDEVWDSLEVLAIPWLQYNAERHMDMAFFDSLNGEELAAVKRGYEIAMMEAVDRHSWLSMQTRGRKTVEFRLWNSTRSAWRMEMAVRTSLLFVNPEAYTDLRDREPSIDGLMELADKADAGLGALLERQVSAPKGDTPFTVLAA